MQSADDAPVALALVRATDVPHGLHSLPSTTARRRTRGGLVVRPIAEIPDLAWAGGAFHARITFEEADSPFASLGVLIGSRDAPVAEHAHPDAWELLSAAVASGALRVPGQPVPGGEEGARVAEHDRAVSDGSVVLVPPGVRHAWQPGGIQPLVAVQAYSPPGPEQRFRALAGATSQ